MNAQTGGGDPGASPPAVNPWLITVVVTIAAFMEVLDTTIVNVALPHIAGSLSASNDEATWCITSYLVANGIVLPISGWLSSIFGRKRYFIASIVGFGAFSLLCGLSHNLSQLIIFRVLQGICGGGLQPSQQAILLDTFPPDKRGQAFSITAVATIVAPVLGPTLGGVITDDLSWRWIFLVNVPVSIFAAFAVEALVTDPPQARARDRSSGLKIDYPGLGLIALGLGCLQVTLDKGEDYDWFASPFIRVFATLAAIGLIGSVIWLLHARNPVVDLRVFANRNFAAGNLMMFVFAGLLYTSGVLLPQLVQQVFGYTSTLAGLVVSPGALVTIIIIPLVGLALKRIQARYLAMTGFLLMAVAFQYSSELTPDIDYHTLLLIRIAQMTGIGLMFAPLSVMATGTLRPDQNAAGASLFTMIRNIGGSIGISVATATVTNRSQSNRAYLAQHLSPNNQPYVELLAKMTARLQALGHAFGAARQLALGEINHVLSGQAAVMAYGDTFTYCGIVALLMVPVGLLAQPIKQKPGAVPGGH